MTMFLCKKLAMAMAAAVALSMPTGADGEESAVAGEDFVPEVKR